MGEISKLGAVSLNCPDPHALAVFYSALLEKEIAFESDDFSAIQLDNLWLSMQRVDDFKPSYVADERDAAITSTSTSRSPISTRAKRRAARGRRHVGRGPARP